MEQQILEKISASVIANQVAHDFNHEIRFTGYYKHKLKKYYNLYQSELIKAEKQEYDAFFNTEEQASTVLYQSQKDMIDEIVKLGMLHYRNICEILKAYQLNPKAMEGIVNKINKEKNNI